MDAHHATEPIPASHESAFAQPQQQRRGPPARRPSNPPTPRLAPPILPGGSHPSPAQLQANNFDSSRFGNKHVPGGKRRKAVWRRIKTTARTWWARRQQRGASGAREEEGDAGGTP